MKIAVKVLPSTSRPKSNPKIEVVSCFKCVTCGFLASSIARVEEHIGAEHDLDVEDLDADGDWASFAQK